VEGPANGEVLNLDGTRDKQKGGLNMGSIKILDPVAVGKPMPEITARASRGLEELNGKVIGMISNEWRCVKIMLRDLAETLMEIQKVANTSVYPVEASKPAPKAVLDKATQENDAIIVAMAN
jgi:hypothetical protein